MSHRSAVLAAVLATVVGTAMLAAAACGADGIRVVGDASGQSTASSIDQVGSFTGGLDVAEAVDQRNMLDVPVAVRDNLYEPRVIRVSVGTNVAFTDQGLNPHNVVPSIDGQFVGIPTGELDPKMSKSITFDKPGSYAYHCSIHGTANKGQRGLIIVD